MLSQPLALVISAYFTWKLFVIERNCHNEETRPCVDFTNRLTLFKIVIVAQFCNQLSTLVRTLYASVS